MENWIVLTFLYAIVIGFYNCSKKKAVKKSSVYEVFFYFSIIAFFLTAITNTNSLAIDFKYIVIIFIRSLLISRFVAYGWICN